MRYLSEIFCRHFWDICTLFPNNSKFLVCVSVRQLAYFLTEIRPIQEYLLFWMRYLSETLQRHSSDISTLFSNKFIFLVSLSVCQLAHFRPEIRPIQGYLLFWMIYLSETFWRHSWDVCTPFPNKFNFFVCLSVCQLSCFHTEIRQIQGYLLFWMIYLSESFCRNSWDVNTLFIHIDFRISVFWQ